MEIYMNIYVREMWLCAQRAFWIIIFALLNGIEIKLYYLPDDRIYSVKLGVAVKIKKWWTKRHPCDLYFVYSSA